MTGSAQVWYTIFQIFKYLSPYKQTSETNKGTLWTVGNETLKTMKNKQCSFLHENKIPFEKEWSR